MSMRAISVFAVLAAVLPVSAIAGPDCRCRAEGRFFQLGDQVCIKTNEGRKLARCEMALNNTSWKVTEESCPTALLSPATPDVMAFLRPAGNEDRLAARINTDM